MRPFRVRMPLAHEGSRRIVGPEAHHVAHVLRVQVGGTGRAFDGEGREADVTVVDVTPDYVDVVVGRVVASTVEAPLHVRLVVAFLKGDKLSSVVRQATEVGVAAVHLVHTRRCDVPRWSETKLARLRRVAAEAAKQSGRAVVPAITVGTAANQERWDGAVWVAHPGAPVTVRDAVSRLVRDVDDRRTESLTVWTGPEGGFDAHEVEDLVRRGATAVTLGPRILRAETAPVAIVSAVMLAGGW